MANKNVSQERMKAKTLFLLLLAMALMSGGVARQRVFSVSGRVIDTSGEGVEGVVVNNGRQFTLTDRDGRWSLLTDTLVSKYISISTPADFCLPAADGIAAGFYVSVGEAIAQKGHDFVLRRRTHKADDFYYVAISDPQVRNESDLRRWREETMADVRRVADSLGGEREVVGVTLGDLVFDDMALYAPYAQSVSNSGMTMFSCIGNHDFDRRWKDLDSMRLGTPVYAEKEYNERFGPTDYSFNIGKAHVVTMKNINYLGKIRGADDRRAVGVAGQRLELCAAGFVGAAEYSRARLGQCQQRGYHERGGQACGGVARLSGTRLLRAYALFPERRGERTPLSTQHRGRLRGLVARKGELLWCA